MSGDSRSLRPIRFVIYITTIFYGLVNALAQPEPALVGETIFATATAATIVGIVQLLAVLVAAVVDLSSRSFRTPVIRGALGILVATFMYEFVLVLLLTGNPFRWAPLLVYAVVCGVLYLAEG